jgi:hypothetical protein
VENAEEQPKELATLRERIGPRHHTVFLGALDYSKLDHADRMTMKAAGARGGRFPRLVGNRRVDGPDRRRPLVITS